MPNGSLRFSYKCIFQSSKKPKGLLEGANKALKYVIHMSRIWQDLLQMEISKQMEKLVSRKLLSN